MKKDISDNKIEILTIKASAKTNLDSITPMIKDISDNKASIKTNLDSIALVNSD